MPGLPGGQTQPNYNTDDLRRMWQQSGGWAGGRNAPVPDEIARAFGGGTPLTPKLGPGGLGPIIDYAPSTGGGPLQPKLGPGGLGPIVSRDPRAGGGGPVGPNLRPGGPGPIVSYAPGAGPGGGGPGGGGGGPFGGMQQMLMRRFPIMGLLLYAAQNPQFLQQLRQRAEQGGGGGGPFGGLFANLFQRMHGRDQGGQTPPILDPGAVRPVYQQKPPALGGVGPLPTAEPGPMPLAPKRRFSLQDLVGQSGRGRIAGRIF